MEELIADTVSVILQYADVFVLKNCLLVCKTWYDIVQSSEEMRSAFKSWGIYVLGGHGTSGMDTMRKYRPGDSTWTFKKSMPIPRCHFAVAVCNRRIYVFGGRCNEQRLSSVVCYNTVTEGWEEMPPMKHIRSAAVAETIGSSIYVIGGYDGKKELSSVERFDTITQQWYYDVRDIPTALSDAAAVGIQNEIYIMGGARHCGTENEEVVSALYRYSPVTNQWIILADMPTGRLFPAAAAVGRQIYVIAGVAQCENGWKQGGIRVTWVSCTEVYDIDSGTWSSGPALMEPRQNPTATSLLGSIYVIGGYRDSALNSVEMLDLKAGGNAWRQSSSLPEKRDAGRAIAIY